MGQSVIRFFGLACITLGVLTLVATWPRQVAMPIANLPSATAVQPSASIIPAQTRELPTLTPSVTPVVPAQTPTPQPMASATGTLTSTRIPASQPAVPHTRTPTPSPILAATTGAKVPVWQGRARFGVSLVGTITQYAVDQLGAGWYLNWRASANPSRPGGIEYAQMIRVPHGVLVPDAQTVAAIARAVPGSLWLVGNEPDRVALQDDATPVQYAAAYHQAYVALKQADPTALVAIGGVIQPSPLRLRYLDAILAAYQQLYGAPMPVDVWNVHNFVLREERGSWGAEIPPGLPDERGALLNIDDNDNLDIFKAQIWAFRGWMRDRGQRDKPLIVSEYGVPMPPDYGFGPERVRRFMLGTFDFFLSARDPDLGYPADENRLVQRWCWYSLADVTYPTGNLFDPRTKQITTLGQAWQEYVKGQ